MPDGPRGERLSPPAEKVLIAVNTFPATGGSRIDQFVKLLPEVGFEPVVLTLDQGPSTAKQELQARLYPASLQVHRARALGWSYFTERYLDRGPRSRHYRLLAALSFPERCILIPDHMVRWIPLAIRRARAIVRREGIRLVMTSSPSESTHLIGLALQRTLGIRWVADFRDLWTEKDLLYRPATPLHDRLIQRLERTVFTRADHVIANTPQNAERHRRRFGLTDDRMTLIPNGFDRDDLGEDPPTVADDGVFRIGYAGNLDKHDFPWKPFLDALRRLADDVGRAEVRFVLCGYCSRQVADYIQHQGIDDLVVRHGELTHVDAMRKVAGTDLLLALLYDNAYSDSIVPLKLYSYLPMHRPILAIAPEEGATAALIRATRTGAIVAPRAGVEPIVRALRSYFDAWKGETLRHDPDDTAIARYDRRVQTRELAGVFRRLLAGPKSGSGSRHGFALQHEDTAPAR